MQIWKGQQHMREILTRLPYDLPGEIYRSPMPFSPSFDPGNEVLDAYVQAGVDTVVMLTEEEEMRRVTGRNLRNIYHEMGFDVIALPVEDFSIPEEEPFRKVVGEVLAKARQGKTIAIHCHAGLGRTGILAACLAKAIFGLDGREAFAWVRQHVSDAVETSQQLQFIIDFEYGGD
ncbi:MAG: dual specificity protein phosphatase family protein [Chloroflexota bacterium]|nr:dual specificity protein phosphatase family protein [Chloroflexota bacterium]